jgi:hypothetical protein
MASRAYLEYLTLPKEIYKAERLGNYGFAESLRSLAAYVYDDMDEKEKEKIKKVNFND